LLLGGMPLVLRRIPGVDVAALQRNYVQAAVAA
jgi:hypothetical protein